MERCYLNKFIEKRSSEKRIHLIVYQDKMHCEAQIADANARWMEERKMNNQYFKIHI